MKIIKLKCQYCGKVIESLYEAQADYNLKAHEISCDKKEGERRTMIGAYNKSTGKYITAWKILKDPEWKGRSNEEFYAPTHEIINWEELGNETEIPVIFVNESIDGKKPHWRVKHDIAKTDSMNKSPEHKKIKTEIYNDIIEGNCKLRLFGKLYSIDELNVEDVLMEMRVDNKRDAKIADISIILKEFIVGFGKQIAIEIQLSKQSVYKEYERSYDRAAYGFSCSWIYRDDYEEYKKNKVIIVEPQEECIKKYNESQKEEASRNINYLSKGINEHIENMWKVQAQTQIKMRELKEEKESLIKKIDGLVERVNNENKEEYLNFLRAKIAPEIRNQQARIIDEATLQVESIIKEKLDLETIKLNLRQEGIKKIEEVKKALEFDLEEKLRKDFESIIKERIDNIIKEVTDKEEFQNLTTIRKDLEEKIFSLWRNNHLKFENYCRTVDKFFSHDLTKCVYWHETLNTAIDSNEHKLNEFFSKQEMREQIRMMDIIIGNYKKGLDKQKKEFKGGLEEDGDKQRNLP